jgi:HD-like signal output (HDOD) protein
MKQTVLFPAIDQLLRDIEDQQLALPTLPDVARKVQHMMDDINFSADQIVAVLSGDPAIAAQVIKTANGGRHADKPRVTNVRAAVARLGYTSLRDLVTRIISATERAQSSHPVISKRLHEFWEHSREVATYCYLLAKNVKTLNPELAMLAGLVHDIGTLPLCLHAERHADPLDHETLDELVWSYRSTISERLLHAWHFPTEIIDAVVDHEDLQRLAEERQASYTDIVAVANLLNRTTAKITAWENVTALERLYLSPAVCSFFHERFHDEIRSTHEMLFPHPVMAAAGGNSTAHRL